MAEECEHKQTYEEESMSAGPEGRIIKTTYTICSDCRTIRHMKNEEQ